MLSVGSPALPDGEAKQQCSLGAFISLGGAVAVSKALCARALCVRCSAFLARSWSSEAGLPACSLWLCCMVSFICLFNLSNALS